MDLTARTLGNGLGLWIAVALLGGLTVPGTPTTGAAVINFLVIGLVLALVNSVIKPVAKIVTFPLYIVSFGLFAFVINGLMLLLASHVTGWLAAVSPLPGLHVETFGAAVGGSIIVSVISALVTGIIGRDR